METLRDVYRATRLIAIAALVLAATSTRASAVGTVWLTPETERVRVGGVVELEYWWDFAVEPVIGGGADIFFDPALMAFSAADFASAPILDPQFSIVVYPSNTPAGDSAVSVFAGNFMGITGPLRVATLSFIALAPGTVELSMATTLDRNLDQFCDLFCDVVEPEFIGATVVIAPVPLPATAVPLISSLLLLSLWSGARAVADPAAMTPD